MAKVLLINGSPNKEGCTYTALSEVAKALNACGVESEIYWIGQKAVQGCIDCSKCKERGGLCVFEDGVNELLRRADEFDGLVVGSPVYYAGPNGQCCAFLDRLFYASCGCWSGKIGAAVVSCRRGGASASFDRLNKYFTISNMPVVSSIYWNQVHGSSAEDVKQDFEGMQTMRQLGRNMAWMLKCFEAGRAAGIPYPEVEPRIWTNFIR